MRIARLLAAVSVGFWLASSGAGIAQQGGGGMKSILVDGSALRKVATGFAFTEGPSWDWAHKRLLFSDIPNNRINWVDTEGKVGVFVSPSEQSNGTFYDPRDGSLLACRHLARDVVRFAADGHASVLTASYDGGRYNSPNDLVITPSGVIYFTDPSYGLGDRKREQPVEGVYRLDPNGTVARVIDDMVKPNGLSVSPDGKSLYVADSANLHIRLYPLREDGTCAAGRTLCELKASEEGVPDGMTLDETGRIYSTGAGGIWVFTAAGEKLGRIDTPEVPANCRFGGVEGRTLYITARTSVYAIDLKVKGYFPRGTGG